FGDPLTSRVVLGEGPWRNLAGIGDVLLAGQEAVDQIPHRQPVALHAGGPTGVQVVALILVLRQCSHWIVPGTEVMQLPTDLFGPATGSVREEWETLVRLGGLATAVRPGILYHGSSFGWQVSKQVSLS